MKVQKPFLKWVGGKTQIIHDIIDKFPTEMNNYHEPFVGGGSVLLALLSFQRDGHITIKHKIYAYDINDTLINVYKHIQNHKDELYSHLQRYIHEYDSIKGKTVNRKPFSLKEAKTSKESYYYWIRDKYNKLNKHLVERSALFMFLNKTCFRGIYREGPNGFNVPYGHYKKTPNILSKQELDNIHCLIKNVEFIHCDFNKSIKHVKEGDFVYLDPPYAPMNIMSFVGYTKNGFDLDTHKNLFNEIIEMDKNNIKFIMSNSKVDLVVNYFKDYNCEYITTRRAIHSKNPASTAKEMIIDNLI